MKRDKVPDFDLYLLMIGFLVRLIPSPFTRDPWDMDTWTSIGSAIYSGQNPYALPSNALIYPPLWAIFCTTSYLSYTLTKNPFLQYFTIKLPIIIADILICLAIKKIVYNLTGDTTKARAAMLLYLFNPVTIIFSSLWGMFDAIPTLFAFLSLLYLSQSEYLKSGLTLGIGIGFKGFFPALLLPFFLLYVWKKERKLYSCLHYTFYSILIPLVISTPFLIIDSNAYVSSIMFHANKLPQNLTYWFLIRELFRTNGIPTTTIIAFSSFLFIASFSMLYFFFIKKANIWPIKENPIQTKFIFKGSILALLIFFLTSSTVNEQYLVWIIPFLIVYMKGYNQPLKPFFYTLCGLDIFFVTINVGPRFFAPIIEMPLWWTNFQYSAPSWALMVLTGSLFSIVCITVFLKIIKTVSTRSLCARARHILSRS